MKQIYSASWTCLRTYFWTYLGFSIVVGMLTFAFGAFGLLAASFFEALLYHFLTGEPLNVSFRSGQWQRSRSGSFWYTWIVIFLPIVLPLVLLLLNLGGMVEAGLWTFQAALIATILITLVTFSLFGTALPAEIEDAKDYRLSKGFPLAPRLFWQLLAGGGVLALPVVVYILLLPWVLDASHFPFGPYDSFVARALISIGALFYALVVATVVAATLTLAYRTIQPPPGPAPLPAGPDDGSDIFPNP